MPTMRYPLTLRELLERPRRLFPTKEIVSRTPAGLFRYDYARFYDRVRRLAAALASLGVRRGDRVATFAWNSHRHLEAYFAVPCMGAVLHTVNIRLPADHLAHVINHAEDRVLLVDEDLLPAIQAVRERLATVERVIVLGEEYEALLRDAPEVDPFPADLDEWEPAGICYSSATTGNPKGVVYAHRAIYLHSMGIAMVDSLAVSERDSVLPVVPMFHVNAWGLPFAATWMGAKQVLPGPRPDPRALCELIQGERVTLAAGVPTVWLGVLGLLEKERFDLSTVTRIVCGGSAAPRALIEAYEKRFGVPFVHAYGMTEAAPVTHVSRTKSAMDGWDDERRYAVKARQGLLVPGLEQRTVDDAGRDVPWDGRTMGEVWLRGPWIADEYYRDERTAETFRDGWYRTGDIATVDAEGYLQIVDRTRDLVKSGGEWISSVALEGAIMAHPAVLEAAVIGCRHEKWQERPVACVVLKPEARGAVSRDAILEHLRARFARWWVPDDVIFLDEIPKTSVGKFSKRTLRERFRDHLVGRPAGREGAA
jgi:fatty-acyl-CoA synthase